MTTPAGWEDKPEVIDVEKCWYIEFRAVQYSLKNGSV
jgi:hypothetical protein